MEASKIKMYLKVVLVAVHVKKRASVWRRVNEKEFFLFMSRVTKMFFFYVDGIDLKDTDLEKEEGIQLSAQVEMRAFGESRVLSLCKKNEDTEVLVNLENERNTF